MSEQRSELTREVKNYFKLSGSVSKWWHPESHWYYASQFVRIQDHINLKGKTIVDIATGKGRFAISSARAGAQKVFAIDISRDMLTQARRKAIEYGVAERITFIQGDAENLPLKKEVADAAFCMEVLVHLEDVHKTLSELIRITMPQGFCVTNTDLPVTKNILFELIFSLSLYKLSFLQPRLIAAYVLQKFSSRLGFESWLKKNLEWDLLNYTFETPFRLKTTEETMELLKKYPHLKLSRANDAIRAISKERLKQYLEEKREVKEVSWITERVLKLFTKGFIGIYQKV